MDARAIVGAVALAVVALGFEHFGHGAAAAQKAGDVVTPIFAQSLPNVPGKALTAVTVDYPPGGASGPHHHDASAFIFAYVVSGTIRSQVNGGEVRTYKAGEYFYEPPGSAHGVSENASATEPARLLAVVVADEGATITTFDE
jgi:quercetin dioxygenase-like cupin family protein